MPGKRARPVRREAARKRTSTKEPRRAAHPTQTAKNEAGLDHYQVRTFRAWYAHITLAMLAAGYLAVTRAHEHHRQDAADQGEKGDPRSTVRTITTARATS